VSTVESRATLIAFKSLRNFSGVSIVIRRGLLSGTVQGVPGDTLVDVEDAEGQTVRVRARDYLVLRTDFEAIIGVGLKPDRECEIDEVVADYTRTHKVIERGGSSSQWWDKAGQVLRIHAVEFEKVTTSTTTAGA